MLSGALPGKRRVIESLSASQPVSWVEVMRLSGLPDYRAVDIALRTQIAGLKKVLQNAEFALALERLSAKGQFVPPLEGRQSPFLYAAVLGIFKKLGHDWVWVGDELCTERKLHWVDDLIKDPSVVGSPANLFSPDKSLLWSVHWDSHFTFLCGSRSDLDRVDVSNRLEGFYCNSSTHVYWSVEDDSTTSASDSKPTL
ncbi:DUF2711 family protein [Dyella sp. 20L07]|uniref:DUF2711 family protein n=1 Tax=Dyella sp. 20L07 TaxID=3384240 RepID=UPI003D26856F